MPTNAPTGEGSGVREAGAGAAPAGVLGAAAEQCGVESAGASTAKHPLVDRWALASENNARKGLSVGSHPLLLAPYSGLSLIQG